ncbi:DUF4365 domain-containing protein [Planosporangium mesophilum]|uniref:DUF4365 domain-containing protein n=1 Tax=Planosporangium mesophilum TaxID=689768 RepID=A0A8J3TGT0_9ACTN|nr:DUF4365 domain-containing protein [Planosporangium mesophilum]NJC82498.1 DUF4365 domain-containing protein [Planosporangium mesophilum]GII25502.1 hypothetical protein Pme01_50990 [Planosporangium mesophilum]
MALNSEVWQGHYGEALVRGLACAAGLTTSKKDLDVDGVDIQIGFPGRLNSVRHPAIEAQVKSWSAPKSDDATWRYPLDLENYDNLVGVVGTDFPLPRYLFLVIVPPEKERYTLASHNCLHLHHAAYWASLMDEPPAAELPVKSTKTVYVPKENLLTVEALISLLAGPISEAGVA